MQPTKDVWTGRSEISEKYQRNIGEISVKYLWNIVNIVNVRAWNGYRYGVAESADPAIWENYFITDLTKLYE